MPDVRLLDFKTPYVKSDAVDVNRRSALSLISQLLRLTGVTDKHLNEQLSVGLWKWTESAGVAPYAKFNLRYVSDGVWNPKGSIGINHEHVWTRRSLIRTLRSKSWTDDELDAFLTQYGAACVVTVQEHGRLGGSRAEGWQRYLNLGIRVWDRQTGELANFTELLGSGASAVAPAEQPNDADDDAIGPADVEESAAGLGRMNEGRSRSVEVAALLDIYAQPAMSNLLRQLVRIADLAAAVSVVSLRRDGEPSDYFRIHDALIGEPTAAVAYPHWNGRVSFRLVAEDLPTTLKTDSRIQHLQKRTYAIQVRIADSGTVELAGELLLLALEKLRDW